MKRAILYTCFALAWVLSAAGVGVAANVWALWGATPHVGTLDLARYWQGHQQECGAPDRSQVWTGSGAIQRFAHCTLQSTISLEPRMSWSVYQQVEAEGDALGGSTISTGGYVNNRAPGDLLLAWVVTQKNATTMTTTNVTGGGHTWTKLFEVGSGSAKNALSVWWSSAGLGNGNTIAVSATVSTTGANVALTVAQLVPPADASWTIESDANFPNSGVVTTSSSIPIAGASASTTTYPQSIAMYGIGVLATNAGSTADSNSNYGNIVQNKASGNSMSLTTGIYSVDSPVGADVSDNVTMSAALNWRWGLVVAYATIPNNTPLLVTRQAGMRASVW